MRKSSEPPGSRVVDREDEVRERVVVEAEGDECRGLADDGVIASEETAEGAELRIPSRLVDHGAVSLWGADRPLLGPSPLTPRRSAFRAALSLVRGSGGESEGLCRGASPAFQVSHEVTTWEVASPRCTGVIGGLAESSDGGTEERNRANPLRCTDASGRPSWTRAPRC